MIKNKNLKKILRGLKLTLLGISASMFFLFMFHFIEKYLGIFGLLISLFIFIFATVTSAIWDLEV